MNYLTALSATAGMWLALGVRPAAAQNPVVTSNTATTSNLYASERIELLPGFQTTTTGFEAKIKLPEATAGRWSKPRFWTPFIRDQQNHPTDTTGMVGIHTHVLPNGLVLSWEGHNDNSVANHVSHAYEWNPMPGAFDGHTFYPNIYYHFDNTISNIFCSGHSFLPDGRLLVAGGHFSDGEIKIRGPLINTVPAPSYDDTNPINDPLNPDYVPYTSANGYNPNTNGYIGLRDVNIFNYAGYNTPPSYPSYAWQTTANQPSATPSLAYRRWYPTATTLADGRILVTAGQRYGGAVGTTTTYQAELPEVYTATSATSGTWQTLTTAQRRLPLYPWVFQAPDGRVFNAGPNYRTGWLNLTAATVGGTAPGTWADGPLPQWGAPAGAVDYDYSQRNAGTAVMYQPGKILILGGAGDQGITNTTELIDLNQTQPAWQAGAPMHYPRYHANATLLADGTVLVTGGNRQNSSSDTPAVLPTELWTPNPQLPAGGSWQTLAALDVPRLYHSTAVLLPDATVLTTGGGQGGGFADHPDYQVFTPPYLCQPGTSRPVIGHVPPAVAYGQTFRVQTPDAPAIVRATWVRLSSVTHSFNMNQRFQDLSWQFIASSGGQPGELEVTAPANANECPPGHYMLFLLNQQGVPSVASIMAVSTNACMASLNLTTALTQDGNCQKTYRFAVSNPVNCGTDYRWWINGTQLAASNNQTYLDYTLKLTEQTVTVRVEATRSCAGATVAAEWGQTAYFPYCGGSSGSKAAR